MIHETAPDSSNEPAQNLPDPATVDSGPSATLRELLLRHAREGLTSTVLPGLVLHRRSVPTPEHQQFFPAALSVVVQGSVRASVGGERPRRYGRSTIVLTSLDLPTTWRVERASPQQPYLSLLLQVTAADVAELLARGGGIEANARTTRLQGAYWRAPLRHGVHEAMARLVSLLDEPSAIPYLARARTEEVLYQLLTGPEGTRLRAVASVGGRTAQVARAIALLKGTLDRSVAVSELARAVHMSTTSLHRHFRALTSLSPGQYHKRLRLHEARRLMFVEGLGAAEAAERVAYRSASQFSRDYRRLYGRPPRHDVARALEGE